MSQTPFLPFPDFVKSLNRRKNIFFIDRLFNRKADRIHADIMNQYLKYHYKNMRAVHSFSDESGQVWDCIPIEQQKGIRNSRNRNFEKEPGFPGKDQGEDKLPTNHSFLVSDKTDDFGNKISCPSGSIPLRRMTMEELLRYPNLRSFKRKSDRHRTLPEFLTGDKVAMADPNGHKYVFAKQPGSNIGIDASLSLWQPPIQAPQIFSLSQMWVIAGSGGQTQTVEAGWMVNPGRFRTNQPLLFIYWTADNYTNTGSFNLEEENTFIQKSNNWALGGALSPLCSQGGPQVDLRFTWHFVDQAWWLFLNTESIGYYPAELFNQGPLSHQSTIISVGGEVSGENSWPPMGSGQHASTGFGNSAYIKNINFFPPEGGLRPMQIVPGITSPDCYNFHPSGNDEWGPSFFYGGPGGNNC